MESKVKLLGHPIHPMLIPFPIGLLSTSLVFDLIGLITRDGEWSRIGFWLIVAGIVGAAAAGLFGFLDWRHIPGGTRARSVGLLHGIGNVGVLVIFVVEAFIRSGDPARADVLALILSLAGVALISLTGWLGGELVDRMGVGVDEGAHLDSPNSLSGRPAAEGRQTGAGRP